MPKDDSPITDVDIRAAVAAAIAEEDDEAGALLTYDPSEIKAVFKAFMTEFRAELEPINRRFDAIEAHLSKIEAEKEPS